MSFPRNKLFLHHSAGLIALTLLSVFSLMRMSEFMLPALLSLPQLWGKPHEMQPSMVLSYPVRTPVFHTIPPVSEPFDTCLIIIHGLTPYGADDPRLQNLAIFFARSGFTVFLPHLSSLAKYTLLPETVQKIRSIYRRVNTVCITWSLFAISVGAGPAIAALSQGKTYFHKFTGLTIFGSYASACRILGFGLTSRSIPPEKRQEIWTLTRIQLTQWAERNKWPVDLTHRILNALRHMQNEHHVENLCDGVPDDLQRFLRNISPVTHVKHIPCVPVFILHSKDDPLIPVSDAYKLEKVWKKQGCGKVNLMILPGLTHVDWTHLRLQEKFRYFIVGFRFFSSFR